MNTTTAISDGVVLDNNKLLRRIADISSDDVASARSVLNAQGVKSAVPG